MPIEDVIQPEDPDDREEEVTEEPREPGGKNPNYHRKLDITDRWYPRDISDTAYPQRHVDTY